MSTYVVIVDMLPPNLPTTTGAADAAGPMMQVSIASHSRGEANIAIIEVALTSIKVDFAQSMMPMFRATNSS